MRRDPRVSPRPFLLPAVAFVLAACADGVTSSESARGIAPPQVLTNDDDAEAAGSHLVAAGCVRTEVSDTGIVILAMPGTASLRFDCSAISRSEWQRAYREEMEARNRRLADESGMVAAMAGYWQYEVVEVTSTCTTYLGGFGITVPQSGWIDVQDPFGGYAGAYYFEAGVPLWFDFYYSYPCTELVISQGEWVEWDDPNSDPPTGGPGGGETPPPPPPVNPDTCPAQDLIPSSPGSSTMISGPLNQRSVHDAFAVAMTQSRSAWKEIGGVIIRNETGRYEVITLPPSAESNNCRFEPDGGWPFQVNGNPVVAAWHTHPYRSMVNPPERFSCDHDTRSPKTVFIADADKAGGGSTGRNQGDWYLADAFQRPVYTIDMDRIYRLDPGVVPRHRQWNPNRWSRQAGACSELVPA